MDFLSLSTESIQATATQAVESKLKIKDFIERHSDEILDELEISAEKARQDVEFLADAFPTVASVVHVGSKRNDYLNTLQWAKGKVDTPDADSAITALTFLYLVHRGLSERAHDSAKLETWNTIKSWVNALLGQNTGDKGGPTAAARSPAGDDLRGSGEVDDSD